METTENNIKIAKFMGGILSPHDELNGVKVWRQYPPLEGKLNFPNNLTFHSDWNLLIDVLKKINMLSEDNWNKYYLGEIGASIVLGDINYVYYRVVTTIDKINSK